MDAESYKILETHMEGKGVSVQSNPMELPEAEAKAVFDQLVKEVVVPKFNKMVDALGAIDLTPDAEKPVSSATQAALNLKVDKEKKTGSTTENKVLSDNNYSDEEVSKVADAYEKRHIHGNKTVLDGITGQDLVDWRGGNVLTKDNTTPYEPTEQYNPATKDYVDKNYSSTEKAKVADAYEKRHTHGNKTVLDGITGQDLADWRGGNVLTKDNTTPYEPTGQYNPATVGYVDRKVVAIGAADMTKAIYDPNSKKQDIFAYADSIRIMTDPSSGKKYTLGVNAGGLYYREVL
ncbi:hypothetical protein [Anaerotignum sp.]|uniref:hypothetical protein n=1 Tax=Anaerotignum sp. TaxID=2039241 RepID=UPI0028974C3F|nr:hypothetical protein [Anaerotignum sp.]